MSLAAQLRVSSTATVNTGAAISSRTSMVTSRRVNKQGSLARESGGQPFVDAVPQRLGRALWDLCRERASRSSPAARGLMAVELDLARHRRLPAAHVDSVAAGGRDLPAVEIERAIAGVAEAARTGERQVTAHQRRHCPRVRLVAEVDAHAIGAIFDAHRWAQHRTGRARVRPER